MLRRFARSQLLLNVSSGFIATGLNLVVMTITYPVYLHFLGYERYGVWLILSTVLAFAQLGNLQIGPAVIRFVAEEYGRHNLEGVAQYVMMAVFFLLVAGTAVFVLILAFADQIIGLFKLGETNALLAAHMLRWIGLLCIYTFLIQAFNATLAGLGRIDLANYIESTGRVICLVTSGLLLLCGQQIESLLIGYFVGQTCVLALSIGFVRKVAGVRFVRRGIWNPGRLLRLVRFSSNVFGGAMLNVLLAPLHKLLLSRYAGVATVPIYDLAYSGSMQLRNLIEAGLRALMPEVSRLRAQWSASAKAEVNRLYRRAVLWVVILGIPVYGVVVLLAGPLLHAWLRGRYTAAIPPVFRLLLLASFLSLLSTPAYYVLLGLGQARWILISHVLQTACSFVSLVVVIAIRGTLAPITVAWTVVLGVAASATYLIWQQRRRTPASKGGHPAPARGREVRPCRPCGVAGFLLLTLGSFGGRVDSGLGRAGSVLVTALPRCAGT